MHRLSSIVIAVLLLVACSGDKQSGQLSSQDEVLYRQAASTMIGGFADELMGKLTDAIEAGGPSNAIYVCRSEAPRVAAAHSTGGWKIGRVSDRNRNPENAANDTELDVMRQFADPAGPEFVERWDRSDSTAVYHFYKPIRTKMLCLQCHGTESNMDPVVRAAVDEYYPGDQARDYDVGDLRGLFVVSAEWPAGKKMAEDLVSAQ